ncbi:MAG: glycoside hydrolase family 28 protein [Saprospiraceae bacterium]|nr:glycoside hydrolase family 28 protein [Saprospiraceae bacterium]
MSRNLTLKPILTYILALLVTAGICAQDFHVADYNIKNDGVTKNTEALQSMIDSVSNNGGGRIIFSKGTYLTGSFNLKSNVELHLAKDAVLLGSTDFNDHKVLERSYQRGLILSSYQDNISITGEGTIDGQGRAAALHVDSLYHNGHDDKIKYNHVENRPRFHMRPMIISFVGCTNVLVEGVTLKDAASWVQHYDRCRKLRIKDIKVVSDAYWNNDGIDISDCYNVQVLNCDINSSDDGICLKSHFEDEILDSVYIANCRVRSSASAVKFGTKSLGGFKNVIIKNIEVYDTYRSAIAIESVDGGVLENIVIDGIKATNTGNAIFIKLGDREPDKGKSTLKNAILKNIDVDVAFERPDYKYDLRGPALPFFHNIFPASITGMPGHNVENVILENITISYPGRGNKALAYSPLERLDDVPESASDYPEFSMFGELPSWAFYVRHVDGLIMQNINLQLREKDYRPAFVFDDVQNLMLHQVSIKGYVKKNEVVMKAVEGVQYDEEFSVLKM